ncbi:hypothetical protein KNZ10_18000 [Streptococcus dysgalactiae subsp. equisimilis]|nr:hypothetical protein KNZ10_18000 [Streptococcus dysgalactiae subsp. equisimilis]
MEAWAGKPDASKHQSTVKIVEASKGLVMDKVEARRCRLVEFRLLTD